MSTDGQIRDLILQTWLFNPSYGGPFDGYDLKRERHLEDIVFLPRRLGDIVGAFSSPESCVVFAERGFGKSTFVELARRRLEQISVNIVAVWRPEEFEVRVGNAEIASIGLTEHIDCIAGLLCEAMSKRIKRDSPHNSYFKAKGAWRAATAYWDLYKSYCAPYREASTNKNVAELVPLRTRVTDTLIRRGLAVKGINFVAGLFSSSGGGLSENHTFERISRTLEKLTIVMDGLGVDHAYVLFDAVDELRMTAHGMMEDTCTAVATLVAPVVIQCLLMDHPRIHFKLFLPDGTREVLSDKFGYRGTKIRTHDVSWNRDDIQSMLSRRLFIYSDGRRDSLNDLSQTNLDELLIEQSQMHSGFSPRLYSLLGKCIFDAHFDFIIGSVRDQLGDNWSDQVIELSKLIPSNVVDMGCKEFQKLKDEDHRHSTTIVPKA